MGNPETILLREAKLQSPELDSWDNAATVYGRRAALTTCISALEQADESNCLLLMRSAGQPLDLASDEISQPALESFQLQVTLESVEGYGWWQPRPVAKPEGMLLTLFALRFPDAEIRTQFIDATRSHSHYCWENEPETQVYGLGIVTSEPQDSYRVKTDDLMVVMICSDDEALAKHRDDPKHLALGAQIVGLGIEVENTFSKTYHLTSHGFLHR